MNHKLVQPKTKRHFYKLLLILTMILLCCFSLGCALFYYGPLDYLYVMLNSDHIHKQAIEAIPEFDKLNDALLESIPAYPKATPLPETLRRSGPGDDQFVGVAGPRMLEICFATDDSWDQVRAFYYQALESDGWKSIQSSFNYPERFNKEQACIDLYHRCGNGTEFNTKTIYRLSVYYDLNVLLSSPGLPENLDMGIERCP